MPWFMYVENKAKILIINAEYVVEMQQYHSEYQEKWSGNITAQQIYGSATEDGLFILSCHSLAMRPQGDIFGLQFSLAII